MELDIILVVRANVCFSTIRSFKLEYFEESSSELSKNEKKKKKNDTKYR